MVWWNKTNKNLVGGGNSQNLNQRFSLTSHTRKGHLQGRPQNNRHSLHLTSPARGGDLHRKSVEFKALAIICLALAIISTVGLSIGRTYSRESTVSSATDQVGDAQVLASNTCDPTNINAQTCASIGVLSSTTPDGVSSGATTTIDIPKSGGIAVGRHTIAVQSNDISGYTATVEGSASVNNEVDLVDKDKFDSSNPDKYRISSVTNEYLNNGPASLPTNTWGIAYPDNPGTNRFSAEEDYRRGLPSSITGANGAVNGGVDNPDNQSVLANTGWVTIPTKGNSQPGSSTGLGVVYAGDYSGTTDTFDVYYGVNVPDPQSMLAGNYTADVVYTVTTNNATPVPTLDKFVINDTVQAGQTGKFAIMGQNLDTAYEVKLCRASTNECSYATNVNTYPGTDKQGTIVSFTSPSLTTVDSYDVYVTTQGGTGRIPVGFQVQEESTCRNGDPNSDCQVDIDDNMIPIAYNEDEDSWQIVTKSEIESTSGSWYDYGKKKWANAITLRNDYEGGGVCANSVEGVVASTFVGANSCRGSYDTATYTPLEYAMAVYNGDIPNGGVINDLFDFDRISTKNNHGGMILGYWVYIPRYAYEVQRPNAIDRVVTDEYELPDGSKIVNEFTIHFEKATDSKKSPKATCNVLSPTASQMWKGGNKIPSADAFNENILAKDYRTQCSFTTRLYNNIGSNTSSSSWATHPAFTFGSTELNGLWIGKFETTGTVTNPTVKPNQHANVNEYLGEFYTMAKHIGVYDPSNTGGNDITANGTTLNATGRWTSLHNLSTATSHMLKNSEWGAIAYLASSKYGAGTNNVAANTAVPTVSADADIATPSNKYSYGITGCGPNNINRSTTAYSSVTTSTGGTVNLPELSSSHIEDPLACGDVDHSYIGDIGQLASTTNNVYGIYDMSGGAYEHVMGNLTSSDTETTPYNTTTMRNQVKPPYVDLYKESLGFDSTGSDDTNPAWSYSANATLYNNDVCAWDTCGGHAIHETKRSQSSSKSYSSWGGTIGHFSDQEYRWLQRGGYSNSGFNTGLFNINVSWGGLYNHYSFHVVLLPLP